MDHSKRNTLKKASLLTGAIALNEIFSTKSAIASQPTPPKNGSKIGFVSSIADICHDLANGSINNIAWHNKIDTLLATKLDDRNLSHLSQLVELEKIKKDFQFPDKGRTSMPVNLGIDAINKKNQTIVKSKILAINANRGIPPHVHDHMSTLSIVLSGKVRLRQFERLGEHKEQLLVRPTADQYQTAGDWSTISSDRSNLHWFNAGKSPVFILNINIENLGGKAKPGIRVAVEQTPGKANIFTADYISKEEAERRFA